MHRVDLLLEELQYCWRLMNGEHRVSYKQITRLKAVKIYRTRIALVFNSTWFYIPIPRGLLGNTHRVIQFRREKLRFYPILPLLQQTPEVKVLSHFLTAIYLQIRK